MNQLCWNINWTGFLKDLSTKIIRFDFHEFKKQDLSKFSHHISEIYLLKVSGS